MSLHLVAVTVRIVTIFTITSIVRIASLMLSALAAAWAPKWRRGTASPRSGVIWTLVWS